ncbi:hypothetical protein IAR55_003168 [Kwoniella newhampshirensis]|uniref:RING-type domain-containing protein n=1 Tax=Kwoniella newhampshirensis TaxID=1651941 RepID=A0AAW0YPW4_9TREE
MSYTPSTPRSPRPSMSRSSPPPPYRLSPLPMEEAADESSSDIFALPIASSSTSYLPPISTISQQVGMSFEAGPSRSRRRRLSSASSTVSENSQSGSYPTPDLSTAPTSPQQSIAGGGGVGGERIWRRTANVPRSFRRNRRNYDNHEDEHDRWLSEDEGLGSAGSSVRTRRNSRQVDDQSADGGDRHDDGGAGGGNGGAGPSSRSVRADSRDKIVTGEDAIAAIAEAKGSSMGSIARPHPVRTRSYEPRSSSSRVTLPNESVIDFTQRTLGSHPPDIAQLVSPPESSDVHVGLGIRTFGAGPTSSVTSGSIPSTAPPAFSAVPDFARGRGGDGINGFGLPLAAGSEDVEEAMTRKQSQKALVEKLRRILACPTVRASGIMSDAADLNEETGSISSGAQRSEMLASGVTYYPPPLPAPPPAYSSDPPVTEGGSPLLDISIDKILQLVHKELRREAENEQDFTRTRDGIDTDITDSSDDEEDVSHNASQASLTRDFSLLTSPSVRTSRLDADLSESSMVRTSSKRRRRDHRPVQRMRPATEQSTEWPFEKELGGMLECDVCALLLFEPVTTPCQHSFCSKCLSRSLDHSSRCPVCRQDLPSFAFFQDHAVNKVLLTILKTVFPSDYAERQAAIERDERDSRLDTPIFVCTLAFPGMPTILHVFEPRYRLMIRRCIESSSPRFGMVLPARGTGAPNLQGLMEYGTMLEIQSVQMLPDGRSMVETVGIHRFKLVEKGNLDGYTVGRIERIDDVSPEEETVMEREAVSARAVALAALSTAASAPSPLTPPTMSNTGHTATATAHSSMPGASPIAQLAASTGSANGPVDFAALASQAMSNTASSTSFDDTPETTEELMSVCRAFIDQLRSGSAPWLLQRLNNTYGSMPEDPSEFSYWMALVMPIDEYEKARLLPIRSPRLRLKLIVHWVESLRSSWW